MKTLALWVSVARSGNIDFASLGPPETVADREVQAARIASHIAEHIEPPTGWHGLVFRSLGAGW